MAHHEFEPTVYHTAIGAHEPVLSIASGDTVSTTTVDARGGDASGEPVTEGGNPQTGPFYIQEAEPGDTIAITFDKLMPNRKVGFTSGSIAAHVLDFGYGPKFEDDMDRLEWEIDFDAGTIRPLGFTGPLENLILPLRPMIGCFGVAPPRGQAISTATSSTHGGNMDYKGHEQGVTVTFPVHVAGALFHMGDGHAVQGCGEIVGTGVEISFDVTFTATLLKGKASGWPRTVSDTHLMTMGNARPLDQALQHATTEMVRWLKADYGLSEREAHAILGQTVEYEVGNVFDPAYTMVCKVRREILAQIGVSEK
jgi:acetamidase/formamidase